MAKYLIGEVEKITGVKAHVLRHWESVIPGFSPKKDYRGKRIYSQRELELIMRFKHLVQTQGMSIHDAKKQIILDAQVREAELVALSALHDIRSELTTLYQMLKKTGENYAKSEDGHKNRT
ncbi:MAG: MerR family transcriptional regulator [Treponema sp.]|nr:MerR family transcriptional regulator [Treponema sp.]